MSKEFALLVLISATTLLLVLPTVTSVQPPVPYFEQRLGIGPLSWSEMAYLRRLAEESDGEMEVTTGADMGETDGTEVWDNSCVSEPVNEGGFSQEEPETDDGQQDEEAPVQKDV